MKQTIKIEGTEYVRKDSISKPQARSKKGLTYCIIRTYSAGVFAGWIDRKKFQSSDNQNATIFDSRRIHYWEGACSISQMSQEGFKLLDKCRIAVVVPEEDLKRVIEVVPCSKQAKEQIEGASEWKK